MTEVEAALFTVDEAPFPDTKTSRAYSLKHSTGHEIDDDENHFKRKHLQEAIDMITEWVAIRSDELVEEADGKVLIFEQRICARESILLYTFTMLLGLKPSTFLPLPLYIWLQH
jgi:hypothetical protein